MGGHGASRCRRARRYPSRHGLHRPDGRTDRVVSRTRHCLPTSDGVYFDVSSVPDYGLLAGQPLESLRAGARVEASDEKRSPLDFALWKNAKPGEPRWPAPFGEGRPGWHTECVVMSLDLLGEDFDLHCGGFDLKFPHHENERAQAVAARRAFARHWDHNGWVMVGGEKMSKSLGNFTSLTELLETTDPRAYRLLVLRSHYRSPIEVTTDDHRRRRARPGAPRRLRAAFRSARAGRRARSKWRRLTLGGGVAELYERGRRATRRRPQHAARGRRALRGGRAPPTRSRTTVRVAARRLAQSINVLFGAMGLALFGGQPGHRRRERRLVEERDVARAAKDWSEADRLREDWSIGAGS